MKRSKLISFVAVLLVLAFSNSTFAQVSDNVSPTEKKTTVPVAPLLKEHDARFSTTYAHVRSGDADGFVLIYCGTDKNKAKEFHNGLNKALNSGLPVREMVWSKPTPDFTDGTECFRVYYNGDLVSGINPEPASTWTADNVVDFIQALYGKFGPNKNQK